MQRVADGGDAIEHDALDSMLVDGLADARKENVHFDFERRDVEHLHDFALDMRSQGQADGIGVANDLGGMLIRAPRSPRLPSFCTPSVRN